MSLVSGVRAAPAAAAAPHRGLLPLQRPGRGLASRPSSIGNTRGGVAAAGNNSSSAQAAAPPAAAAPAATAPLQGGTGGEALLVCIPSAFICLGPDIALVANRYPTAAAAPHTRPWSAPVCAQASARCGPACMKVTGAGRATASATSGRERQGLLCCAFTGERWAVPSCLAASCPAVPAAPRPPAAAEPRPAPC